MSQTHQFKINTEWTDNLGQGTLNYLSYSRDHILKVMNKPELLLSSYKDYQGNENKHNPEDLFISSISSCHMLWYLHLCAENKIRVFQYKDEAIGTLKLNKDGSGKFIDVSLYPIVFVENETMIPKAKALHSEAHNFCFIASSCNFPIRHFPKIKLYSKL